jgi:hypothetical protein
VNSGSGGAAFVETVQIAIVVMASDARTIRSARAARIVGR